MAKKKTEQADDLGAPMLYQKVDEKYLRLLYDLKSEIDLSLPWEQRKAMAAKAAGVSAYEENFHYWEQVRDWFLKGGQSRDMQAYLTGLELFANAMSDSRQPADEDKPEKTYESKFKNWKNGLEMSKTLKEIEKQLFGMGADEAESMMGGSIAEKLAEERTNKKYGNTD